MRICDSLVADFEAEVAKTRAVLEAVPSDKLDWKPHAKSMTLGQLAGHVAENAGWVDGFFEDDFDLAAMGESYKPFLPRDRAELLATFDASARTYREKVGGRSDEVLARTWTMRMGPKVLLQTPRHAAIRSTLIHHLVHHRGQLTVYLRLLGAAVPQTYGPTADRPDFA